MWIEYSGRLVERKILSKMDNKIFCLSASDLFFRDDRPLPKNFLVSFYSIPPCLTKIILLFSANVAAYTTQVVRLCMRSGRKCFTTSTFYVKAQNQKPKLSKSNIVYQVFTRSWILGKGNLLGEKMERKVGKVERSKLETSVENGHTKVSCLCMHSWILHEQTEKENVQVGK